MNLTFGTPGGAPGGGFSFSTPASTIDTGAAKQVRFNTPLASTASPFASFGAVASSAAPSNTLSGLLSAPTATTTSTGLTFGAGAPAAKGFGFGAPATSTPALALSTTLPNLGSTSSAAGSFGVPVSSTAVPIASSGLGGFSSSTTSGPTLGLGGLGPVTAASGTASVSKPGDTKTPKEMDVPAPILETVNQFTKNMKEQKAVREEIARMSSKSLYQVEEDVKTLRQQLMTIASTLQRYTSSIDRLKQEATRELRNADIAQRTRDTPLGLQFENTLPCEYFERLIEDFHNRMSIYRQQITETESHFSSGNGVSSITSPQDLQALLTRLNEGFLSVTAHLHTIHEAVSAQKEAYLRYRKAVHGDYTADEAFNRRSTLSNHVNDRSSFLIKSTLPQATMGVSPFASSLGGIIPSTTPAPGQINPGAPTGGTGLFGSGSVGIGTFSGAASGTTGTLGSVNPLGGGTGLFGASTAGNTAGFGTSTGFGGGGLFGGTASTSTGLFGNPASSLNTGTGLFGSTPATNTGLFGSTPATNTGAGLFSSPTNTGGFGATTGAGGFGGGATAGGFGTLGGGLTSTAQKPLFGTKLF